VYEPGGVLGLILLPHYSLIDSILVTFGQICNFRDPSLVTFYFYEVTHFLNWMKNTLLFTYSTNILVSLLTVNMKNCLTPKTPKMCDPILVTLLKLRPHYSQSSRENATPFSSSSPLASYKEVPPLPHKSGAEKEEKEVEKLWEYRIDRGRHLKLEIL